MGSYSKRKYQFCTTFLSFQPEHTKHNKNTLQLMLKGSKLHFLWAADPTHSTAGRDLSWSVCLTFILFFLYCSLVKITHPVVDYVVNSTNTELEVKRLTKVHMQFPANTQLLVRWNMERCQNCQSCCFIFVVLLLYVCVWERKSERKRKRNLMSG